MTGGELSAEERRSLGCQCVRLDAVWHHVHGCPVPLVTPIVAALVAAVEAERDEARAVAERARMDRAAYGQRALAAEAEAKRNHEWWTAETNRSHVAEAEVARLTAERDEQQARAEWAEAQWDNHRARAEAAEVEAARVDREADSAARACEDAEMLLAKAEAENRRLAALVEAGLALVDEVGCFAVGEGGRCTDLIGGTFQNGKVWTMDMCCLPCRLRALLGGTA